MKLIGKNLSQPNFLSSLVLKLYCVRIALSDEVDFIIPKITSEKIEEKNKLKRRLN